MRITTRIAAGGHRSLTRIPFAAASVKECLGPDGKFDRAKAQLAFDGHVGADGWRPFIPSSRDDLNVYFASLTFLELLHDAYAEVIANPNADCHSGIETRQDERLEAKMAKGRFVYVRQDVNRLTNCVSVRVTVGNPFDVVGEAEMEARTYATTCIQLWLRMMNQVKWLRLDPTTDADLVADAREKNQSAEDRRTYGQCDRRVNGFCSPCKTDCKFFRMGKCGWK